jgi:hypothetical protein
MSAFHCSVCKVEFAWSPRTPTCKTPPFRGGVANPLEWKGVVFMTLLVLLLFLLYRTRRIKLKIEIDL